MFSKEELIVIIITFLVLIPISLWGAYSSPKCVESHIEERTCSKTECTKFLWSISCKDVLYPCNRKVCDRYESRK